MLEILKILSDYGWSGLVFAAAIVILWKMISNKIKKIYSEENEEDDYNEIIVKPNDPKKPNVRITKELKVVNDIITEDLHHHPFFAHVNYALTVEIPSLDIFVEKPVRQELLKDLIYISLHTIMEFGQEIIENDYSSWSKSRWAFDMNARLSDLPKQFSIKATHHGIPEIVIKKYFRWYIQRLDVMREFIDQIANSFVYSNNTLKVHAFLMVLNIFTITLVADAERTLKTLNGELTGKDYKNKKLEECSECHSE